MSDTPLPSGWISQILEAEESDARFELFANDVVQSLVGHPIVPTSKTWDLGRDGRAAIARQAVERARRLSAAAPADARRSRLRHARDVEQERRRPRDPLLDDER